MDRYFTVPQTALFLAPGHEKYDSPEQQELLAFGGISDMEALINLNALIEDANTFDAVIGAFPDNSTLDITTAERRSLEG